MFIADFKLKTLVQKVLCDLRCMLEFPIMHPGRELERIALQESVEYIRKHMPDAVGLETARQVLDMALSELTIDGHILEFGVFQGGTITYIAERRDQTIHGFDSFQGLPEKWSGGGNNSQKGAFSMHGKLPKVPFNVRLHKGLFSDSLPKWLAENPGPIALVHIDCDIYSSTKCVFDLIQNRLVAGSIIVFDEYFNYHNWQRHEYRAFQEMVHACNIKYDYISFARIQVAVKIREISPPVLTSKTVASELPAPAGNA
jgi:hypothetical protein